MTPASGRHLDEAELIDGLDGALPGERRMHLERCEACRSALADVTSAMAAVSAESSEVPEPPPFYWEQLSARVRSAVRAEPQPRFGGLLGVGFAKRAVAAALAIGVVAALVWRVLPGPAVIPPHAVLVSTATGGAVAPSDDSGFVDIENDSEWALVRSVADALPDDAVDAAGIVARPGSAESVALSLSPRERAALAEILRDEMARATPRDSAS